MSFPSVVIEVPFHVVISKEISGPHGGECDGMCCIISVEWIDVSKMHMPPSSH
jgi:hypothetical protein